MSGKKSAGGPPRVILAKHGTFWSAPCPPSERDSKCDRSYPAVRVMPGDDMWQGSGGGGVAGHLHVGFTLEITSLV